MKKLIKNFAGDLLVALGFISMLIIAGYANPEAVSYIVGMLAN